MKNLLWPFLASALLVIVAFISFESLESFFSNFLQGVQEHPGEYAVYSSLILALDIVLPVPSSIVMYTNGYVLGLPMGALVSFVAMMLTASVGYYLGRFTAYGFRHHGDGRAARILGRYGGLAILVTRGIPILAESVCFVCGYNRMPFRFYLVLNAIGYLPVVLLYAAFGSLGFDNNTFLISFGCSVLFSVALWVFGRKLITRVAQSATVSSS